MCGIVGFTGKRPAAPLLVEGLARLEYRGYDSAGIATADHGSLQVRKRVGRIANLQALLAEEPADGTSGICHTRWATHGVPSDANSHPHLDQSGRLALVHNGVIENFALLKERLAADGHTFVSQTDTEVLAHLIGALYDALPASPDRLLTAVKAALPEVTGTYGIAVMHADCPGEIVGARRGSPLVIGIGDGEYFLASDVTAVIAQTREVIYLNDYDIVHLTPERYTISSLNGGCADRAISRVDWDASAAERGLYPHFMLKEIFEQPSSVENALRGRLDFENATANFGGLNLDRHALRRTGRLLLMACGTALHAARVGEYVIEELSQIPVDCDFASEFRYRNSPMDENTIAFVISQSGETADSLAAMREARRKGVSALGIVNTVGSTIARESDGGIYLHAGPEIGVAATKSFTSQCTIFGLLALYFGRTRHLSASEGRDLIAAFQKLPDQIRTILERNEAIRQVAVKYAEARSMLFLGRLANYPIAQEGALKLKEISYLHAEALPAAELKHGIIALISPELPTVIICPKDGIYDKNLSTIQEIKARSGPVIAVCNDDDDEITNYVDDVLRVPRTHDALQPILNVIPLQLFAYHIAVHLGRDVDKPRNLAKSVTVE